MLPSSPRRSKRSSVRITEVIIRPLDATDADSSLGSGGPCDPDGEFQSFLEPMPVEIRRRAGRTTGRSSLRHSATDDIVTASKKPITEVNPALLSKNQIRFSVLIFFYLLLIYLIKKRRTYVGFESYFYVNLWVKGGRESREGQEEGPASAQYLFTVGR